MTFYDILKRTGARGFNTRVALGAAATGVTQVIAALQTTPLAEPMKHKIHVQKLTVIVTTASAAKTWQFQDGAGSPVTIENPLDMSAAAGTKYTFDFGPSGFPLTLNKDLNVNISAAGAAADIFVEGYQEPDTAGALIPTVVSISPNSGPQAGGTSVAVFGTGFKRGATVAIGGVACTSVQWIAPQEILCVTGAHAAGAVNVVVTNPAPNSEVATGVALFTYV